MHGLACVMVLYNPDWPEVFANMQTFSRVIDHFFLVDNSKENNSSRLHQVTGLLNVPISYIPNGRNAGIARALNQGCCRAYENGFSWCLLMDQDSFFFEDDLNTYFSFFNQHIRDDSNVGILSLLHGDLSPENLHADAENVHSITSGSIISLPIFMQAGGHDEFLFIDEVDADYSYRLQTLGYSTIRFNKAVLQHRLGEMREVRLFGLIKVGKRTFHAPWRNYYMMRNYLIVRHRFVKKLPEIYKKRDRDTMVSIKNDLFLSGQFFSVLYQLIHGLVDGIKYRRKLPVSDLTSSV